MGGIYAIRAVGCSDETVVGIIRLALIGGGLTSLGFCSLTGIGYCSSFARGGLVAIPLIFHSCHVSAFLFCHQSDVSANRNGLRHWIQWVEEWTTLVIIHIAWCCIAVAYYIVVLVIEDMGTRSHLLCSERSAGLGACIWCKDKEWLVVFRAPPVFLIIPNALFLLRS